MKKILLALSLIILFASCTKETGFNKTGCSKILDMHKDYIHSGKIAPTDTIRTFVLTTPNGFISTDSASYSHYYIGDTVCQ